MPIMDGMLSTRAIRDYEKDCSLSPTMIVALTGQASLDTQVEAHDSGFNFFLSKPTPLKKIKAIVEERLGML
jgi:CheY-like chemotaxis protein